MTSDRDHFEATRNAPQRDRSGHSVRFTTGPTEFVKAGLSRFDPYDPYYFAVSLGWGRFFLLFLVAELVINTIFALLYMLQPGAVAGQPNLGFFGNFFFSLETLATVGYGELYPATRYGHIVSGIEILTGVIFTAIMTGLLFVRFAKPKAKILYAKNAVLTLHNGKPTLMLRIANARHRMLLDAHARLHTLLRNVSTEGQRHASVVDLPLIRERSPSFAILWTLMHVIDEASPLRGLTATSEDLAQTRFFLSITAHDPAIGQAVSELFNFAGTDIRFGMRYVDAVEAYDDGRVVADYRLLSALEPDNADQFEGRAIQD